MIDNKIMYEIVEKLHQKFSADISICDASGRVIVSTATSCIGEMSLLAIEVLNINARVIASENSKIQRAGASMPLCVHKSRIGAVVIWDAETSNFQLVDILAKTIELLYEELTLSKKKQNRTQERDQFLYEWLHLQTGYTESLIKRGEHLGINIVGSHTVILMERNRDSLFAAAPIIQNLLDERDILLPLSRDRNLLILKEDQNFEKKYHRVIAAGHNCHTGICSGGSHLLSSYQSAQESLDLGKILFPNEHLHSFERMKLAIALSKLRIPELEQAFSLLVARGGNAQLAETAITYIQLNGDVKKVCEKLHIHRNSISYRLCRIQKICGCNLADSYDLLYLYASLIRYLGTKTEPSLNDDLPWFSSK